MRQEDIPYEEEKVQLLRLRGKHKDEEVQLAEKEVSIAKLI